MRPSRWPKKNITQPFSPADIFSFHIFKNTDPFMKYDHEQVGFLQRLGKPVPDRFIFIGRQFLLESAKHFIPDDEYHSHVFVNIFLIRSVMHAMVRRSYKNIFKPPVFLTSSVCTNTAQICEMEYISRISIGLNPNNASGRKKRKSYSGRISDARKPTVRFICSAEWCVTCAAQNKRQKCSSLCSQ